MLCYVMLWMDSCQFQTSLTFIVFPFWYSKVMSKTHIKIVGERRIQTRHGAEVRAPHQKPTLLINFEHITYVCIVFTFWTKQTSETHVEGFRLGLRRPPSPKEVGTHVLFKSHDWALIRTCVDTYIHVYAFVLQCHSKPGRTKTRVKSPGSRANPNSSHKQNNEQTKTSTIETTRVTSFSYHIPFYLFLINQIKIIAYFY